MSLPSRTLPLFCLLLGACAPEEELTVPERLAEANRLYGQASYTEAIEHLERVVEEAPEQAQAWLTLARSHRQLAAYEDALEAAQRAAALGSTAGQGTLEVFFAEAGLGRLEDALATYDRLRTTPLIDFSGLHLAKEIEALRGHPGAAVLFPEAEIFGDLFVEGRAVIHDWYGEGKGHEFGWEARNAGDVDRDGVDDAVVSAPANQPGGDSAGKVYLYSGRRGSLLWSVAGAAGDQLGMGVEAAGDVNRDGIPDVVAGAPGAGRVYVYSGSDGSILHTFEGSEDEGGRYGTAVAGIGDINDDGHGDLVIGSPASRAGAGRAYVHSGSDGTVLLTIEGEAGAALGSVVAGAGGADGSLLVVGAPSSGRGGRVFVYRDLSGQPGFTIEPEESGAQLGGMFASVVGDVDADGVPDVYASDWQDRSKGLATGRIYVHSGADGRRLLTLSGEAAGDGFGIGPARAGDVDGDGHDDLVVGAWQHGSAAHSGGKIYVFSGKDGGVLATYTGKVPGETLGFDADGMGDVDGDGSIDFLVTSAWSLVQGPRSGRTLVLSGRLDRAGE